MRSWSFQVLNMHCVSLKEQGLSKLDREERCMKYVSVAGEEEWEHLSGCTKPVLRQNWRMQSEDEMMSNVVWSRAGRLQCSQSANRALRITPIMAKNKIACGCAGFIREKPPK